MKSANHAAIFVLLNALAMAATTPSMAERPAGEAKQRGDSRQPDQGGKGSAGRKPQWAADPERGWVRSDRRREIEEINVERRGAVERGRTKPKDKGKKF